MVFHSWPPAANLGLLLWAPRVRNLLEKRGLRVTTETGSVYDIDENGICRKFNKEGVLVDSFKPYIIKPVPDDVYTIDAVLELPEGAPEVGKLMYVSGINTWWISTMVVKVEY